ncbi:IS5 family transposase [Pseudomonas luteola]|uniref:IS5 family transposase n=1 Tax=Pseudomonas luteola TaxID=47886 RepID=UPI001FCA7F2B|nr:MULTISPECIES: IS5 family transposase [Pseudomonas]
MLGCYAFSERRADITGRYKLDDQSWERISDLISYRQQRGRHRKYDCLMLNGIFCVLCSRAKWRDLPDYYGAWQTVYHRFRIWRDRSLFTALLKRLHLSLRQNGRIDLNTWMIDLSSIRVTRAASGAAKKRVTKRWDAATVIWPANSIWCAIHKASPLSFTVSPDHHADNHYFSIVLEKVCLPSLLGRPIKRCRTVLADKGYNSEALRQYCDRFKIKPIIPLRQMHRRLAQTL